MCRIKKYARTLLAGLAIVLTPAVTGAQEVADSGHTVVCESAAGKRHNCKADIRGGVTLRQSTGTTACVRDKTWGVEPWRIWVKDGCSAEFTVHKPRLYGRYTPISGFKLADTEQGDLSLKVFAYVRYLNQRQLDRDYTDSFGNTNAIDLRQDILFQKVNIQLLGWVLKPNFRYYVYSWTSNASQGLVAQVVLGGYLTYAFNDHITLNGGINALPGVRATEGNFPLWLTVDNRLLADEFFRPSYTMGVWAKGKILSTLSYNVMIGNNLSQLGVDAGQLDNKLNTWSTALIWLPTTGEFGTLGGFGDFDHHKRIATRLAAHFTRSTEDFQGQPNTEQFENVQIRLSDGSIIFKPNLFGPGIRITDADYHMISPDAGLKYHGFSLEGEYYWRWVDHFKGPGTNVLDELRDHGFQLQASAMAVPKTLQLYIAGSKVYGQHGDPSDFRIGVSWFPFATQVARWNAEYLHLSHSPVGALSLPGVVGGNGPVFYSSFELNF